MNHLQLDGLIAISQKRLIDMALLSVGTNPLTRTNCTAATASAKTSKATATSIQTRPTKSSQTNLTSQSTFETEHPRTNPSASKSQLVTAVSLSITGLLLLALFAVAVVIFKRRRYHAL